MSKSGKYAAFHALDPFFEIIQKGLAGLVDGGYFFDAMSRDVVFEALYHFPGWPRTIRGSSELMDRLSGYGDNITLLSSDGLNVHRCEDRRIVIIEYEVHGKIVATGAPYDNRFISVITIENRKIVR
jgi:ketosteroid isomerase-like protein